MLLENIYKGPAICEGSFKLTKTIYHLNHLAMESSKMFVSFPTAEHSWNDCTEKAPSVLKSSNNDTRIALR